MGSRTAYSTWLILARRFYGLVTCWRASYLVPPLCRVCGMSSISKRLKNTKTEAGSANLPPTRDPCHANWSQSVLAGPVFVPPSFILCDTWRGLSPARAGSNHFLKAPCGVRESYMGFMCSPMVLAAMCASSKKGLDSHVASTTRPGI